MSSSWFDQLEARLEQQLESFLRSNPEQEALLAQEEQRARQQQLQQQQSLLQRQAEEQRQALLKLAEEIRQWQQRIERARQAAASELTARAEAHVAGLMEQGRQRWQALEKLGQDAERLHTELASLRQQQPAAAPASGNDLERDWAAFEAEQDLNELRRKQRR